jgi:hypothetical protein
LDGAMTVFDVRCDRCGTELTRPTEAVRFLFHPGDFSLKDDSGLLCRSCWRAAMGWFGVDQPKDQLRTVDPKLSVEALSLAGDWRQMQS